VEAGHLADETKPTGSVANVNIGIDVTMPLPVRR
jgi:hypothetical protein